MTEPMAEACLQTLKFGFLETCSSFTSLSKTWCATGGSFCACPGRAASRFSLVLVMAENNHTISVSMAENSHSISMTSTSCSSCSMQHTTLLLQHAAHNALLQHAAHNALLQHAAHHAPPSACSTPRSSFSMHYTMLLNYCPALFHTILH